MALYALQVPDPPAGVDWFTTVPGQYLYNVTGVTALLTTESADVANDATGHGNSLPYLFASGPDRALMQGWPGVLVGDTAQRMRTLDGATFYGDAERTAPSTMRWDQGFTIEFWAQNTGPGYLSVPFSWVTAGGGLQTVQITAAGQLALTFNNGATVISGAGICPFDGAYHHYVVACPPAPRVGAAWYFDGDPVAVTALTGAQVALPATDTLMGFGASAPPFPGAVDEGALYPYALSAAQVNAHFVAAPDFAAYSAAVLADTPAAYWHFDEEPGTTGRQVAFEVTDGSNTVADIPTGFDAPTTGTVFGYSWQPGLGNRSETLSGALISVPTPGLILPAGYTMGTKTPGLRAGDQWSDIVVWWNSNIQDARGPIDPFVYPPGAHLVYVPPAPVA